MRYPFMLRRYRPTEEASDYVYQIVERVREHPLGVETIRHIALVHSEEIGEQIVVELNKQRWKGVVEGMTRFAWWRNGEQMVGTCGQRLKDAIADLDKEQ